MIRKRSHTANVTIDLDDIDLSELIECVKDNANPEDVFDDDELGEWAKKHGWIDFGDEE